MCQVWIIVRAFYAIICVLITFVGGFFQTSYCENELAVELVTARQPEVIDGHDASNRFEPFVSLGLNYKKIHYLDTAKSLKIEVEFEIEGTRTELTAKPTLFIEKTWRYDFGNDYFSKKQELMSLHLRHSPYRISGLNQK